MIAVRGEGDVKREKRKGKRERNVKATPEAT